MTVATVPDSPPLTARGSFEVVHGNLESRRVFAYWQKLPQELHNGPDFTYTVTEVFENGLPQ